MLVEVVADDGVAAVVAEGLDLVEQAADAAAGAVVVLAGVGRERVEPLDGVQAPAQVAGDLPQAAPFGPPLVDQFVVPPGALGVLPGGAGLAGGFRFRQGRGLLSRGHRRRPGQAGAVGGDALLDGLVAHAAGDEPLSG